MTTVKGHLYNALAVLAHERHELNCALQLATDTGYNQKWLKAIDKALIHNDEATLHLKNVQASIGHPAEPPYGLKPGLIQPKVL